MNPRQISSSQRADSIGPTMEQFRRIRAEVALHRADADFSTRCAGNLKS